MSNQYKARIEITQAHEQMMKLSDLQQHIKRRLAAEFLSTLEEKLSISQHLNINRDTVSYEGSVVILTLDQYNALRYNNLSSEDKFKPFEPKQEFDAVNYLKNLMKKSR